MVHDKRDDFDFDIVSLGVPRMGCTYLNFNIRFARASSHVTTSVVVTKP